MHDGSTEGAKPVRKFLFVSFEGLIHDLAWQISKEGHLVKYCILDKAEKDIADGFVDKVDNWEEYVDWADVVVFDDIGFGEVADKLRAQGKPVIGGTPYTDRLEDDRNFGQDEMKAAGISILPHWDFTSFDDALKFLKENPGRYVIKPSGKAQNEKELCYVGQDEDGKDIIEILELYKTSWGTRMKEFQLQKFASGVEVAVGAFFNGSDFIYPINVNFEHKRMFPGDIGPNTGEMGTSMFWTQRNKIFDETLLKMKEKLAAAKYVGYVDINCIANVRGIYPLEFTTRFGYPTINIQMEGVLSEWGEFLYGLARGEKPELKVKRGFQVGVVVAVPPFPFTDPQAFKKYSEDAAIIIKKSTEGIHIGDVKCVDGKWRLAGHSGYALIVTGSGSTMADARRVAYNRVANIHIPNMFYRTDIGEKWTEDSDRLQTWGYLY
ncbi:MAG: phosphoribosylglycinamide synthetase C domain-containing protein [Thermoplasmata archaeon]